MIMRHLFLQYSKCIYGKTGPRPRIRFDLRAGSSTGARQLPPLRDIQHAIDLVPGSQLSNLPHYRMNPKKREGLNRQVEGLFERGLLGIALEDMILF